MNFYQSMNHLYSMPPQGSFHSPAQSFPHTPSTSSNRFIYVKSNFLNPAPAPKPKVLVNPHFKQKVYVNPQFHQPKPKIHVNPNILKHFPLNNVPKIQPKPIPESKSTTVISTRNKLIRVPCNSPDKYLRKRRNSLHSKYKIVRSSSTKTTPVKTVNKFKLDKRVLKTPKSPNTSGIRTIRKKYVYVNRFLSMNVVAKNVLFKNATLNKRGFVNINGILYKKSPNSLKKASETSILAKKDNKQPQKSSRRSVVKRYKIVRSKNKKPVNKASPNSLRKCNIPCPVYRKFGKCSRKENGTCFKVHNPDQIVLCTRFLQGACYNKHCPLSHKVSHEKMPTCKYYLEGLCSKDDCFYLHVKISPKAEICRDFLEGFCKKAAECDKRHQFLCPDFEKNKTCPKKRCPYPHGNTVRNTKVLNSLAKKCSVKKDIVKKIIVRQSESKNEVLPENNRYYKDSDGAKIDGNPCGKNTVSKDRPKLGALPEFIPFFEAT